MTGLPAGWPPKTEEELEAYIEAHTETIDVPLNPRQFEAAIYALRCEAHRQDPREYPRHSLAYPDYDPDPSTMADLADYLMQKLIEAGVDIG